ncbi:MAG: carboxypeptidase regulatory-like domain-containing protein [Bacteroidia bacterium]
MKKIIPILLFFSMMGSPVFLEAQSSGQVIKGIITDKQSKTPLPGVTVVILQSNPAQGCVSDATGHFRINGVLPGRYELKVYFLGYKEQLISNILVNAGKEIELEVDMEENITALNAVVISGTHKNETNNELTTVSGRSFSMEEVNRYAGGRSDPARLASSFAGVSAPDDARNDLVIRGNSPSGVLWRMEGLNIPNPNHFATVGTTGGPVSAINTNVLRNSDFFTSAFPSEYGNANAGVFDLGFRNGNAEKREYTFQLGALTGVEAMAEGPLHKSDGSSYLIAYRYSFTGLAQKVGIPIGTTATPFYQDLSFKLNGGYTKWGRFTLFGLGGVSTINFLHNKIDSTDLFADPSKDSYFTSTLGLVGLKHFIRVGSKSYFSTVLGVTYASSSFTEDSISHFDQSANRIIDNSTVRTTYSLNTSFNSKISSRLFIKTGVVAEVMDLNLFYRVRQYSGWNQIWNFNDYTTLFQGYAHAKYSFNSRLTLNAGLHSQYLTLNNATSLEPRIGLKYQLNDKNIFSLGYGLHSQMQPADVYFFRSLKPDGTYDQSNRNVGFTRSEHVVAGYDLLPFRDWHIKTEVYYQYLYDVPVSMTQGSFSMLNTGASFNPNNQGSLVNTGTGTNYGVELTVEKFFNKGYYALLTGSLYESRYKGSDQVERNTAFNGKYVYNVLLGKEFKVGHEKRNALTVDVKLTQAGGRYFTPVDLQASQLLHSEVLKGDVYAFTQRNPDFFRLDVKTGFTLNGKKRKLAQSIFFDVQNVTNNKNVFAQRFNPLTNSVNTSYQIGLFPNFVYKIQF